MLSEADMASTYDLCAAFTRAREGGFTLHADDPGNWTGGKCGVGRLAGTNAGVSAAYMAHVLGPRHAGLVTVNYMHNISLKQIEAAYARFWDGVSGALLPPAVALMVFDHGFNCGPVTSAKILQDCVGAKVDGDIGPHTVAAANAADQSALILALYGAQTAYYRSLNRPVFINGWLNRARLRRDAAIALLSA